MVISNQVTVTTSATPLFSAARRTVVTLRFGTLTYVGDAGVGSSSAAFVNGDIVSVSLDGGDDLYGIVTAGTATVHVLAVVS